MQQRLDGFDDAVPVDGGFRGPQVCAIVGITYRQLDYWARQDLVKPSIADARGSGTQRSYSFNDLVRLKVIKNLLDAGVKLQTARKAIEYLREDLGDDWATANLVLDGTSSVPAGRFLVAITPSISSRPGVTLKYRVVVTGM